MLIRILGEGQFEVPDSALEEINRLDNHLEHALNTTDDDVQAALDALLAKVREVGVRPADSEFVESEVILPFADAHEEDIRAMLQDDGLIPG